MNTPEKTAIQTVGSRLRQAGNRLSRLMIDDYAFSRQAVDEIGSGRPFPS